MRVFTSRRGFSLVELLTVIAIIAVLAGIIFPVLGMVKGKANTTKCITQLHEIGLALQVFKQDNRKYPDILGAVVVRNGSDVVPFDQTGTNPSTITGLYPEYVKAARLYHCPASRILDTKAYETYAPLGTGNVDVYSYNSYDFFKLPSGNVQPHYTKSWAATPDDVQNLIPITPDNATKDQNDYARQLKFRTPPDSTVVTWCSWHETISPSSVSGKTPTLFLDGHVDSIEANIVENQKWRTDPKKE